jgi:hypothetical protein
MATKPPQDATRIWFHRSVALTLAVGACLLLLFAVRPGYGAFFVTSTVACLLAGFLWAPGEPPRRGLRERAPRRPLSAPAPFSLARSYRITTAR